MLHATTHTLTRPKALQLPIRGKEIKKIPPFFVVSGLLGTSTFLHMPELVITGNGQDVEPSLVMF